jgi:electron transport complex protein RnfG
MEISNKCNPLIFIAAVTILLVTVLAITNNVTSKKIEALNNAETVEVLRSIFMEADYYTLGDGIYTVYDGDLNVLGYAFYAEGMSYGFSNLEVSKSAAPMVILVGLEDKNTIKGITVISQEETAYFWNLLEKNNFSAQFIGLSIADCYLKKDGGQIDSITGATYSSRSVIDIVREAIQEKAQYIN